MNELRHPVQVVVAYDFSPSAEEALMRAVDVAARAPQHVLHIVSAVERTAEATHQQIYERACAAFAGREAASEVQFYIHARIGHPAEQVLAVAEEVGADLIFIGSHGKTGIERLLLGSVSERVVREARCPVMVVRPKQYESVDLLRVMPYPHERHAFHAPHRYAYVDRRVITRPRDFPLY